MDTYIDLIQRRIKLQILFEKFKEISLSVIPIAIIVLGLHFTIVPLDMDMLIKFLICTFIIIVGLGIFLMGAEIGVSQMGEIMGSSVAKSNSKVLVFLLGLLFGFLISIAEADLLILANQVSDVMNGLLPPFFIVAVVSLGVGVMIGIGFLRILMDKKISNMFIIVYMLIFGLFFFVSEEFQAISFDASGATTGAMTTPFILALGLGVSKMKASDRAEEDSFGLVGAASAGPIWALMIMSLVLGLGNVTGSETAFVAQVGILAPILNAIPKVVKESLMALIPITTLFFVFNHFWFKRHKDEVVSIFKGLFLAFLGLVLFLVGVNAGFMDVARIIGSTIASLDNKIILPLFGFVMGMVVVLAEPAVYVLSTQVEEVTAGSIPRKLILLTLSIGVAFAVSISMLKIMYVNVKLWMFIIPGFLVSLYLSKKIPPIFVGIAFDSGGVASGPMTATFILALTQGAASAISTADVLIDGFGVIAMVAMTPILGISLLGLIFERKSRKEGIADETL